jgi:hypothetical protein
MLRDGCGRAVAVRVAVPAPRSGTGAVTAVTTSMAASLPTSTAAAVTTRVAMSAAVPTAVAAVVLTAVALFAPVTGSVARTGARVLLVTRPGA